jgi:hypothetical protein
MEGAVSNGVAQFLHQFVELVQESLGHLEWYGTVCRNLYNTS